MKIIIILAAIFMFSMTTVMVEMSTLLMDKNLTKHQFNRYNLKKNIKYLKIE